MTRAHILIICYLICSKIYDCSKCAIFFFFFFLSIFRITNWWFPETRFFSIRAEIEISKEMTCDIYRFVTKFIDSWRWWIITNYYHKTPKRDNLFTDVWIIPYLLEKEGTMIVWIFRRKRLDHLSKVSKTSVVHDIRFLFSL